MPNVAVPPPPSEEIFDESEPSYGIALYDFEPIQDGDLGLRVSLSSLQLVPSIACMFHMGHLSE